jgi:hypothetical protein
MTLVKSAPKKVLPKNLIFSIAKIVFWLILFLGALFAKVICTFLKSVRKDGFLDAPFDLFKEKSFHLLEGTMNFFESCKRSKMEETAQKFEKRFFIMSFQNCMSHIEFMKFCQNQWSLMSKLLKKPSALKREHLALQNLKFLNFFSTFVGRFCPPGSGSSNSN